MEAVGVDTLVLLALVGLVAGFIDAVAGGGGLLTVPALALAGFDPVTAVATNKLQGVFGTGSATFAFARRGHIDLRRMWPLAVAAAAGSIVGALMLTHVPREAASGALPIVLIAVALYFALSPRLGNADAQQRIPQAAYVAAVAPLVGFYDGVFGPGAGSLYMVGFVGLLGFGIVKATAHTKLANFASNVASLLTYVLTGHIVWSAGLAMGAAQLVGGRLGAEAAMRGGARLVKPLLISMSVAMALRLASMPPNPFYRVVLDAFGRLVPYR